MSKGIPKLIADLAEGNPSKYLLLLNYEGYASVELSASSPLDLDKKIKAWKREHIPTFPHKDYTLFIKTPKGVVTL